MTYLLLIKLYKDIKKKIGVLGILYFKKGLYLYIGSAKKNFRARIERHLLKKKRMFWHIDYLLSLRHTKIKHIWVTDKNKECYMAGFLYKKGYSFVNGFGSSDCNCPSHLFFVNKDTVIIKNLLNKLLNKIGLLNIQIIDSTKSII
ncbi:MAG: GIY-YIG nuclease family protein [Candidatus Omnitrophica bacterium]|nr:GIY-YIG nuclease family protein [Candidatus Omnitrophota bacterium]